MIWIDVYEIKEMKALERNKILQDIFAWKIDPFLDACICKMALDMDQEWSLQDRWDLSNIAWKVVKRAEEIEKVFWTSDPPWVHL